MWLCALMAALWIGLAAACATTFKCGADAECNIATEYCMHSTPGAVRESGAPSPISHCMRFEANQSHECPDFKPASGCGCSKDWLTGAISMGCNAP